MPSLRDLVDANSRIRYDQLVDYIGSCPVSVFTEQATAPFLVGKQLYEGKLRKNKNQSSLSTSTMMFERISNDTSGYASYENVSTQSIDAEPNPGISHAIYLVRKKLYSTTTNKNVIAVGRSRDNDIVIADYVISKNHAQIINFHDMFFIVDLHSTNGTYVNHRSVKPNVKVQLPLNSTVSFGRLVFILMSPVELYRALRRQSIG